MRNAREKANLTQSDVAYELGYSSPQFISNIERGVSVSPLKLISQMTKLYKINANHVAAMIMKSQKVLLHEKLVNAA